MTNATASLFDNYSIEQLEAAVAARQESKLAELQARRIELLGELRYVEAELAKETGSPPPASATLHAEPLVDDTSTPKKPRRPIGSLILKALAASHPSQMNAAQLAGQLRASANSDRLEITIQSSLARFATSGLLIKWEDGGYSLTPDGLRRAGAG